MDEHITHLFRPTATYNLGAYRGKHVLEKHLGHYVSTSDFINIMKDLGYTMNKHQQFKVKERKIISTPNL